MAEKAEKKSVIELFLAGARRGFKIGIEQILPAMIFGYALVLFLQLLGVMDIISKIFTPVMAVFGLPGESVVALLAAFFAKASGVGTAAMMVEQGTLTLAQATMITPACILMGTLIGHYARIVLVADTNKKWHGLLLVIPIIEAFISIILMRIILSMMGLM